MSTKPLLGSSRSLATYFFFWQIVEIFFNGSLEELSTPEFWKNLQLSDIQWHHEEEALSSNLI